ncbi:MAG TPA: putative baseplate assembly protein [Kofleriaceae bacterium]
MTRPWWGKDVAPTKPILVADTDYGGRRPRPHPIDAPTIAAEIRARIAAYTPTWTNHQPGDAGEVMIDLFAAQAAALAADVLDGLPLRTRLELLRVAGIDPVAPHPRETMLVFDVSASATGAIEVPQGFQASGSGSDGSTVIYETDRDVMVVPATISTLAFGRGQLIAPVANGTPDAPAAIAMFGAQPQPNDAFYVGLDSQVSPSPQIAIAWFVAGPSGAPSPESAGVPAEAIAVPVLIWEVYDGAKWSPASVVRDQSAAFTQSGVVELGVPRIWPASSPAGLPTSAHWLRARLVLGQWPVQPVLQFALLNCVPASSGQTIRDEVLDNLDPPGALNARAELAKPPVLDGTLVLTVDEGDTEPVSWDQVDDLSQSGPADRDYVLDPVRGIVTFGDGNHGMPLPAGYRNVIATAYRTISPDSDFAPGGISTMLSSAPFVTSVSNPIAVTGGTLPEEVDDVVRRGPQALCAGGRAIAASDYEICALSAPADVRRAHAVPGMHPDYPGAVLPGVVGVFCVPADPDDGNAPMPDALDLAEVAQYLADNAAPAGVEVVAIAPSYRQIRCEMQIVAPPGADLGDAIAKTTTALDAYLHPLTGGDDGDGWPFGGTIRPLALIRFLLVTLGGTVLAIPRLNVVLDNLRSVGCVDVAIGSTDLLWPVTHEIIAIHDAAVSS